MPTNKRESLIFTIIMCFFMVLWMSVYNVARVHDWTFGLQIFADAWLGFPPAYIVAMLLDVLVASRFAKWFAFRLLVTPGKSSKLAITLAISTMMVFPMVLFMSLYGAIEAFTHVGDPAMILPTWISNIPGTSWLLCPGTFSSQVPSRATCSAEPSLKAPSCPSPSQLKSPSPTTPPPARVRTGCP